MNTLHFARPGWIFAGLFLCLVLLAYLRASGSRRQARLQRFVSGRLMDRLVAHLSPGRRRLKQALLLAGLFCCFLALARPQYGYQWQEVQQRGVDILLAVDTSRSMLTPDVRPNRLERARLAIRDFVRRLEGDRVGLLPFAGTSFLLCPLTTDYEAFNSSLDVLDTSLIPRQGTNLASVIREATRILANKTSHKFLILVTDGENLEGDLHSAAEQARAAKLTIFTVGVGTPRGELIPLESEGEGAFLKDAQGRYVTSRLDEANLKTIARTTGGIYVPLGDTGQGFAAVYEKKLALVPKEEYQQRMRRVPRERFAWPLALALVLLTIEYFTDLRAPALLSAKKIFKGGRIAPFLLILLLLPEQAGLLASQGEALYRAGQFDKAAQYYDRLLQDAPQDAKLHFNSGAVAYRRKRFKEAIDHFSQALATDDLQLQADSYYNLGNSRYQLGQKARATDADTTIRLWTEAVRAYDGCLQLDPDNRDAAYNRELVRQELEKLKRQQQKKRRQQQNQQQDKGKDNRKQKQDKGGNGSNGGGSSEQRQSSRPDKESGQQNGEKSGQEHRAKDGTKQLENKTGKNGAAHKENETSPDKDRGKQGTAMSRQDRERRQQGRMTVGEARALLESLADEEGKLNFIPQAKSRHDEPPAKDW